MEIMLKVLILILLFFAWEWGFGKDKIEKIINELNNCNSFEEYYNKLDDLNIKILIELIEKKKIKNKIFVDNLILRLITYKKVFENPAYLIKVEKIFPDMWWQEEGGILVEFRNLEFDKKIYFLTNLVEYAKLSYKNKKSKAFYSVKRYLVYFFFCSEFFCGLDIEKDNFLNYGIWALYDKDEMTASVIDPKSFKLKLKKGKSLKIFNGNGRSKTLYYACGRIKKLIGKSDNSNIEFMLEDKFGWSELILPEWIGDESIELTIEEIYKGSRFKNVFVSEITEEWEFNNEIDIIKKYIYYELLPQLKLK
ncbi:MAG: hypothetical protein WHS77_08975 [Brevinematales bacterium]